MSKGYIVERLGELLVEAGVRKCLINIGGDLRVFGGTPADPFRIGIRHPVEKDRIIGTLQIIDGAVATSGDYEKFTTIAGKRYSHILDPRTGMPVTWSPSVTVVAKDAVTADGFATGASVLGIENGLRVVDAAEDVDCIIRQEEAGRLVSYMSAKMASVIHGVCSRFANLPP